MCVQQEDGRGGPMKFNRLRYANIVIPTVGGPVEFSQTTQQGSQLSSIY